MPHRRRNVLLWLIVGFVSIVTSCPTPFREAEISLLRDTESPVITITTPVQGTAFESTVTVSGTVLDRDGDGIVRTGATTDFISSCNWDILDSDPTQTAIDIATDGTFSFTFPSAQLAGQITLVVAAEDANGNAASASLILVADEDGPFVAISSPEDYSEYATLITLEGTVTNGIDDPATTEVDPTVTYSIPGTAISGAATIDAASGAFTTTLDVASLDGSRTIEVTATDLNGNETTAVVTIVKPADGGDISGFTVTPGNKQVTITWDAVLGATSYSIQESAFGLERTNVASPYTWDALENGTVYSFQLVAHVGLGPTVTAESATASAMPMSPQSLTPWVREVGFNSITIEWTDYPEIDRYVVERSDGPDGPWETWRLTTGHVYTDERVQPNTGYFYRVVPSDYPDIASHGAYGVPGSFGNYGLVSRIPNDNGNSEVLVHNGYVYADDYDTGTWAVDVSDPANPGAARFVAPFAGKLAIEGDYLFISGGSRPAPSERLGVSIIDVTNPTAPTEIGFLATPDFPPLSVSATETRAYINSWWAGGKCIVADVTDRSNPSVLGSVPISAYPKGVTGIGETAFVVSDNGLTVIDASDPLSIAGTQTSVTNPSADIDVVDNVAYLAEAYQGLAVASVANPLVPGPVATTADNAHMNRVVARGATAYLAGGSGLFICDVSDTTNPNLIATRATMDQYNYGLDIDDRYAYVASTNLGISIFSITDARDPAPPVYLPSSLYHEPVVHTGTHLMTKRWTGSLGLVCATDLVSGTRMCFGVDGLVKGVEVVGNHLYVASGDGLTIIDISDIERPGAPITVDVSMGGVFSPTDVDVVGDYAFLTYWASGSGGLVVVDVSDPTTPGQPYFVNADGFDTNAIAMRDGHAFIAANSDGLVTVDLTDLENPGVPLVHSLGGTRAFDLELFGDYALVAVTNVGLAIVDVSNPDAPGLPVYASMSVDGEAIDISWPYAFVSTGSDVAVVDFSDPTSLGTPTYLGVGGDGVVIHGDELYSGSESDGIAEVDLWAP